MNKLLFLLFMILPILSNAQSFERNLISSAGSQNTKGSVSLDWSLGETLVADFKNSEVSLSQGLNQWVKIPTAVEDLPDWNREVLIYPNPFSDIVTLKSDKLRDYTVELFSISGNFILRQKWNGVEKSLQLEHLQEGGYFFIIKDNNGKFIILKSIKQSKN